MDKICLELATFEEFITVILQTVAKKCLSSQDDQITFLITCETNYGVCNGLKKKAI